MKPEQIGSKSRPVGTKNTCTLEQKSKQKIGCWAASISGSRDLTATEIQKPGPDKQGGGTEVHQTQSSSTTENLSRKLKTLRESRTQKWILSRNSNGTKPEERTDFFIEIQIRFTQNMEVTALPLLFD
jgi:hypothetical protein